MSFSIETTSQFDKDFKKLDRHTQLLIKSWIIKHQDTLSDNPRVLGKALKGNLKDFWRYRVGNYRLLAKIQNDELILLLIKVGHRKKIYR
ncbi:MAG: type II toxin-antitoxin system RelE/ParE family toxin [Pasteurella sp.]|nr:type II toxin-antitoxin system RelE/ParE family toxin [Pasteurella sp.]